MEDIKKLEYYDRKAKYYNNLLGGAKKKNKIITLAEYDKLQKERGYEIKNCSFVKTLVHSVETRELYKYYMEFLIKYLEDIQYDETNKQLLIMAYFLFMKYFQLYFRLDDSNRTDITKLTDLEYDQLIKFNSFKKYIENCIEKHKKINTDKSKMDLLNKILNNEALKNTMNVISRKIIGNSFKTASDTGKLENLLPTASGFLIDQVFKTLDENAIKFMTINFDLPSDKFFDVAKNDLKLQFANDVDIESKLKFIQMYIADINLLIKNSRIASLDLNVVPNTKISYEIINHDCTKCTEPYTVKEEIYKKSEPKKTESSKTKPLPIIITQDQSVVKETRVHSFISDKLYGLTVYETETKEQYNYYKSFIIKYLTDLKSKDLKKEACLSIDVVIRTLSAYCIFEGLLNGSYVYTFKDDKYIVEKKNIEDDVVVNILKNESVKNVMKLYTNDDSKTEENIINKIRSNLYYYPNADLTLYGLGEMIKPSYINPLSQSYINFLTPPSDAPFCYNEIKATKYQKEDKTVIKGYIDEYKKVKEVKEKAEKKEEEIKEKLVKEFGEAYAKDVFMDFDTPETKNLFDKNIDVDKLLSVCGLKMKNN